MDTFNLNLLSVGTAIAATGVLGFVIYFNNRTSITSKYFLGFSFATIVWSVFHYSAYQFNSAQTVLWMLRLEIFSAVWLVFLQFVLIYVFPKEELTFSKKSKLILIAPIAVSLLNLTPLVFQRISKFSETGHVAEVVNGPGIIVFGITVLAFVISGITILIRKVRATQDLVEKKQFRSVLWGIALMFSLLIIFAFIFPAFLNNPTYVPLGAVFIFPFVGFTGYAIFRHGLLNVKVISTEILTLVLAIAVLFQLINSHSTASVLFTSCTFLLVFSVGILLIRSVVKEVEQRELLQQLSTKLESANNQLIELDKAKSEFLSVASHQLRTPLTAIKGYVSMILEGDFGQISQPQRDSLQIVFDSTQRLVQMISELLDLSRIESGRMEFDFKATNLCKIIESVIEELSSKASGRKLYLFFDNVNRACPDIRADEEKLRQVIVNLIDNAIKYTKQGGVTVRLLRSGNELKLAVVDTGIGIAPEDHDKMFEKFFRTAQANEVTREGTGLGIYVARKIAEAQSGKMWFESAGLGKGTTFYLTLPIPTKAIKEEKMTIASMEAF